MFVRNSPLLDVLHCDFLYRAPWHGPLLAHPRFKRKEKQPKQTEFPFGFYERSTPAEKVCTASLLVIRRCVKSPRRQQTRGFPIALRQISCSTFARSDPGRSLIISPFFRPTKLPAYPGSPTPGAPAWTSPPASAHTAGSTFLQLPSLKAEERYFSSFHSFGSSSLQLALLWFGKTINRHKSVEPLLDGNRAKRSNGRTSDFRFEICVSEWPLCIQPNLVFYVVIIVIMLKWPHSHRSTVRTFCWTAPSTD